MQEQNYALYYPTIEFQDYAWLWSAALLWDRIYRIVPSSYTPNDSYNVKILTDTGEIGIPIYPDSYAQEIAVEFIEKLKTESWDAAALMIEIPEEYALIHQEKVDVKLRELIVAKGKAEAKGEWLSVPIEFEALYMTYLTNKVAEQNNLAVISDSTAAWTGETYFRYNGRISDFPQENLTHLLATIVIRDFIPENIISIDPKEIIKFRRKYRDERQRLIMAIRTAADYISNCNDSRIISDYIEDFKKDIESALIDYRRSLEIFNIARLTGMHSIIFPSLTKIATALTGHNISVSELSIISALGFGFGLVSGLLDWKPNRYKLSKASDYSYLLHLKRDWKGFTMYGNDYNYFLCREMEEFLND